MSCSPLLRGVTDPLRVLMIVSEHPVLCCSEPPQTFRPLAERGWVVYQSGRWRITDVGYSALSETDEEPQSLMEFFEL